jgi:hypothetical protein
MQRTVLSSSKASRAGTCHYPIPYFLQNKTIIAIEVKRDAITFYATRKREISIIGVMCVA